MRYLVNRFVFRRDQFSQKRKIPDQLLLPVFFMPLTLRLAGCLDLYQADYFLQKRRETAELYYF